ncbi:hypothetical protein [Glycomyces albidus]|uniref:Uncharacterized protein n=1 Tax=Glycomyces albidus TaxID=2656774 RepID=A0A6L5G498_9ACTN|nr:hypothetical protein [Glycomyces albidus]MQM24451.1 hypothetical protein [Glycomyces albidus]
MRRPDPLERGRFSDGSREYVVCASSLSAPDSFQVWVSGNRADIVMVVSGLNSRDLHATWGEEWRTRSVEWREWARTCAFHVFHNGSVTTRAGIRHCDG